MPSEKHHSTCVCNTCNSARAAGFMRIDELPGITLRDFFAGCALAGMLNQHGFNANKPATAKHAYKQADAMLAAREEKSDE